MPWGTHESEGGVNFAFFAPKAFYKRLGIRSILHSDYKSASAKLASFGLQ